INRKGQTVAEVGEIVDIGDIIISGKVRSEGEEVAEVGEEDQNSYFVHAEGEVWARTRYETTEEDYIISSTKKETVNVKKNKGIKVNGKGTRLCNDIPFDNYEEYVEEKNLIDFPFLSIDFIKITNYEYREVEMEEVKQDIDYLKKSNEL